MVDHCHSKKGEGENMDNKELETILSGMQIRAFNEGFELGEKLAKEKYDGK